LNTLAEVTLQSRKIILLCGIASHSGASNRFPAMKPRGKVFPHGNQSAGTSNTLTGRLTTCNRHFIESRVRGPIRSCLLVFDSDSFAPHTAEFLWRQKSRQKIPPDGPQHSVNWMWRVKKQRENRIAPHKRVRPVEIPLARKHIKETNRKVYNCEYTPSQCNKRVRRIEYVYHHCCKSNEMQTGAPQTNPL